MGKCIYIYLYTYSHKCSTYIIHPAIYREIESKLKEFMNLKILKFDECYFMVDIKKKNELKDKQINFRISKKDRDEISLNAQKCNLSVGEYLRLLGMGYTPKSNVNLLAINDMLSINADLGRLGGLLKLWLTDDSKLGYYSEFGIRHLLRKIEFTRRKLEERMEDIFDD